MKWTGSSHSILLGNASTFVPTIVINSNIDQSEIYVLNGGLESSTNLSVDIDRHIQPMNNT